MGQDTKVCWQCRTDVQLHASVCPSCRAKLGSRKANGMASRRLGWLAWTGIGCGGFFLLITIPPMIIAATIANPAKSPGPRDPHGDTPVSTPVDIPKAEARFKALRPLFLKEVDKFDQGTLWRHKAFSQYVNGNGTTLSADIWNSQIRLTASYQGSEWIFFKDVLVKANGSVIEINGRPEHHVGGGVTEYLHIKEPVRSQVIAAIYAAQEKPVEVRLSGKFTKDFTLKPAHKKAIQQTVEFFNDLDTLRMAGKLPKGDD